MAMMDIAGADAREDRVAHGELGRVGGDERADLREEDGDADRADVRRLAAHVRAGDHLQRRLARDERDAKRDSGCGAKARAQGARADSASFIVLGLPGGRGRRRNLLQSARSFFLFLFVRVRLPVRGQGGPRAARGRYATLGGEPTKIMWYE